MLPVERRIPVAGPDEDEAISQLRIAERQLGLLAHGLLREEDAVEQCCEAVANALVALGHSPRRIVP